MANIEKEVFTKVQWKQVRSAIAEKPSYKGLDVSGPEYFLLHYVYFESLMRLVLRYYGSNISNSGAIRMNSAENAFKAYGMKVPKETLKLVLDSKSTTSGSRSARNLRNALVHNWPKRARVEVSARASELNAALKKIISAIEAVQRETDNE